jgi:DNA-directed RNA polymerase specialized sigma24 family protein
LCQPFDKEGRRGTPLQEDQSLNASIDALARTYGPPLERFFERRLIERADIDDLVQRSDS